MLLLLNRWSTVCVQQQSTVSGTECACSPSCHQFAAAGHPASICLGVCSPFSPRLQDCCPSILFHHYHHHFFTFFRLSFRPEISPQQQHHFFIFWRGKEECAIYNTLTLSGKTECDALLSLTSLLLPNSCIIKFLSTLDYSALRAFVGHSGAALQMVLLLLMGTMADSLCLFLFYWKWCLPSILYIFSLSKLFSSCLLC